MIYLLSLGTNIGDRAENIQNALDAIGLLPKTKVLRASSLYETEPVGYADQQSFYNIAAEVESAFEPAEMLGACLGIEAALGRVREFKNGPRIIDIDIIFAEDMIINEENLIVPHPRYHERRFVLVPLLELYPDGVIFGINILPFLDKIDGQEISIINS